MIAPQRLTRLVSAALIAAALIAPTAVARPAGPDPSSSGQPGPVAAINPSADTVVSSRTRRCGDLLVAQGRPFALPSCPGRWQFIGGHQGRGGRDDHALGALPCTPSCDPGVLAHLGSRVRDS
jgi:hypothetical protein